MQRILSVVIVLSMISTICCFGIVTTSAETITDDSKAVVIDESTADTMPDNDIISEKKIDIAELAASEYTSGNYRYKLLGDGTACIVKYNGSEITVNIPSTLGGYKVTQIGDYAFNNADIPEHITIPDTVKSIGIYAFCCEWLESVTFGTDLEIIGDYAFNRCKHLKSLNFKGSKLKTVDDYAFNDCTALTSVKLPSSVTTIGKSVFFGCKALKSFTMSTGLTKLDGGAFYECESLTSITLPDTLTEIGSEAFRKCTQLKSVVFPKKLTTIGSSAFAGCKALAAINLPNTLRTIGGYAFQDCDALTKVVIPDSVSELTYWCFSNCDRLAEVKLGKSVPSIPLAAFSQSTALKTIKIPDSVTKIEQSAFSECSSLQSVTCKSVRVIERTAFYKCTSLKTAVLGESLKSLGYCAFDTCTSLTAVYLPKTLREVESYAFGACPLRHVYFSGSKATWNNDINIVSTNNEYLNKATFHYNYNYSSLYTTINPTGIALPQKANVYIGKTITLSPSFTPSNTTEKWVNWSTSNKAVAVVNANGAVTGKSFGTAVITATADNGLKATCTVSSFVATPKITSFANTASGITINWSKALGTQKYRVFLKNGTKWVKLGDTAGTAFHYKKVRSGVKYIFTIRCVTNDGTKAMSGYNTTGWTTTYIATPAAPVLKNTKNGIQVSWKRVAGAANYRIFRKIGNGKWTGIAFSNKAYVDKTAKNGVTYTYTIRCVSADKKSYTSAYNTKGTTLKCKR